MLDAEPFPSRTFGVLLHPTSLAGPEPIGTLGAEAEQWIDWLATTGAGVWQILPLTYIGQESSPYFSASAFAGNPWLISLRELTQAGLLDEVESPADPSPKLVDFEVMRSWKQPLLQAAADRFLADPTHIWRAEYVRFLETSALWLPDACHFFALKQADPALHWWEWDEPLRRRDPSRVGQSVADLATEIEREQVLQFFVERQWNALRQRATAAGIALLGDVPIYVAPDSVDVWTHQDQFELDADGRQISQAGVPPDYFSDTGQLWKNPLYRWDAMEADGFSWWISRLKRTLEQTDVVRIDHFRALSAYWSVPAEAETAIGGEWVTGPGQAFVDAIRNALPDLPIVAEDLGDLDDDVVALRDDNDLLGMRVIQFGFSLDTGYDPASGSDTAPGRINTHHPDNIVEECIVYTGTHDNDTLLGWWQALNRRQRAKVRASTALPLRVRARRATRWLIGVVFSTKALVAVVPLQDLLGFGSDARMNTPGTEVRNWQWRMPAGCLTKTLAKEVRQLADEADRLAPTPHGGTSLGPDEG